MLLHLPRRKSFQKFIDQVATVSLWPVWTKENKTGCVFKRSSSPELSFSKLGMQISKRCSNRRRRGITDESKAMQ
jgi:hypothetical protein